MKKIALIAALGAAAIFTACGDDDSGEASCTIEMLGVKSCIEGPSADEGCADMGGTAGSGCDSGASFTCQEEAGYTSYYYGELPFDPCQE